VTVWPLLVTGAAAGLCAAASLASLVVAERWAMRVVVAASVAAALLAFAAGAGVLEGGEGATRLLWSLPVLGPLAVGTTRLGGLFTCVAALVYVPTSIFTLRYAERYAHEYSVRPFAAWYGTLLAAVIVLFVCRDVVSFFVAWEVAAIASAALVAFEWRRAQNTHAAFVMLGMSEAGTMAALLAVLIALAGSGSLVFGRGTFLEGGASWLVFLLSFFGFGVKAGLLPVNSWLPRAHPLAPGSISALLSGVILNLGVYGIVLVNAEIAPIHVAGQGVVIMIVGVLSAIAGILYATIDDDLKALLAYSSIENIGIAMTGFGIGFVFVAEHQPAFASIGFAAGAYHLANHSAYKGLLFLGAAAIDAQTGTRSLNRMGGLMRRLPATSALFLIGVMSIAAIPPLNGFASEWLTFQSLLRAAELPSLGLRVVFALCGATLALTAALAVTCFVKAYGMAFLGKPRSPQKGAGEPPWSMRAAMGLLVLECVLLGIFPAYVLLAVGKGLSGIVGPGAVADALVPPFFVAAQGTQPLPPDFVAAFHALGAQITLGLPGPGLVVMLRGGSANPVVFAMSTTYLVLILGVLAAATAGAVFALSRRRAARAPTWAGGLGPLPPEMTYTATGFSNPVRVIFDAIYHPTEVENERETIHEHFRSAIRRARQDVFLADRYFGRPLASAVRSLAALFARIHHGRLPVYVAYAIGTVVAALLAATLR
jgi:hydrogenase-4 component B